MHKITYRKATSKDESSLFDLSVKFTEFNAELSGNKEEFFYKNWRKGFKDEIRESIEDEKSVVLIALDGEIAVGYIYARYCRDCYYYIIDELYVDNNYRGMQIGETLLQKAITYGKKFKLPLRIEVYEWNKSAIEFYKKRGFKIESYVLTY